MKFPAVFLGAIVAANSQPIGIAGMIPAPFTTFLPTRTTINTNTIDDTVTTSTTPASASTLTASVSQTRTPATTTHVWTTWGPTTVPTTLPGGGTYNDTVTVPPLTTTAVWTTTPGPTTVPTTLPGGGTDDDMVTFPPVVDLIRVDKGRVIQALKKRCGGLICSQEFGCQPVMCDESEGVYTKTVIQAYDAGLSCPYWNRLYECQGATRVTDYECQVYHPCRALPVPRFAGFPIPIGAPLPAFPADAPSAPEQALPATGSK